MRSRRHYPQPHKYRDVYGDLIIDGHTYLGRVQVPPLPNRIAMADRTTGEMKVLGQSGTPGALTLNLQTIQPFWSDVTKYGPLEGPYSDQFRLVLDNGVLSAEYAPGNNSRRLFTRNNNETTVLEITVNPNNGAVIYTEVEL